MLGGGICEEVVFTYVDWQYKEGGGPLCFFYCFLPRDKIRFGHLNCAPLIETVVANF